jgi:hypothetical protein
MKLITLVVVTLVVVTLVVVTLVVVKKYKLQYEINNTCSKKYKL